jgi:hypothetical protein
MRKLISKIMILALIGFGCGAATEFEEVAPLNRPIKNTEVKDAIGFKEAVSEIPPSEVIGGMYKDIIKIRIKKYYAAELVEDKYQRIYEYVIHSELIAANYNCISENVVFDTARSKPRFLLGAVITEARLNNYVLTSEYELIVYEYNSEALLNIRWELYDTQEKKIIFSHKELGTSRDAESGPDAYREAVRISFRNFLAEKELVEILRKQVSNNPTKSN